MTTLESIEVKTDCKKATKQINKLKESLINLNSEMQKLIVQSEKLTNMKIGIDICDMKNKKWYQFWK